MTAMSVMSRPLRVTKDDVLLDFGAGRELPLVLQSHEAAAGATREQLSKTGLRIENRHNVTIRNLDLTGFKVGIWVENCRRVVIENCHFSGMFTQYLHSTPDAEDGRDWLWPHNNDNGEWAENYGAAIYLKNCRDCRINQCRGRGGQNGVILDRCSECAVHENDFSYHSGWGCALWRSSDNIVNSNRFDYCVRGYSHGAYARGQDSAGILIFEQCNDNLFAYNSATHSGDGFFLYAGHETTQRTGKGGCNRNLVYANDFSYAVANGIEATFSAHNEFAANRMIGCDYGIWAGYSYFTRIVDNLITDSLTAGVAIEHGHDNAIVHNTFQRNRRGVWLWWDDDKQFLDSIYGQNQDTSSSDNRIRRNTFETDRTAVWLERTTETLVRDNEFRDCEVIVRAVGDCSASRFEGCNVFGGRLEVSTEATGFETGVFWHADNDAGAKNPGNLDLSRLEFSNHDHYETQFDPPAWTVMPVLPWGRESILMGVYGPLDVLAPALVQAPGMGSWYVLGGPDPARTEFSVSVEAGEVDIERFTGKVPCGFRVRPKNPGVTRFDLRVKFAGLQQRVSGTLARVNWQVSFWKWEPADGHDGPADWAAVVAGEPLKILETDGLNYMLQGRAPEDGVPAEFYATVATTTIELREGMAMHVTSDDGVRIYIDGQLAHENWGIHGPTTEVVPVPAGKHTVRIEHFQRQGWAALKAEFK